MRPLDQGLVLEVWQTLASYESAASQREARAFIDRQPHLVALARSLTEELGRDEQRSALGLLFFLTKVIEAHREAPAPSVSRERVAEAYAAATAWMERWEGADERFLAQSGEFPQPHLIPYLIDRFHPDDPAPAEYAAEVKGNLFLLLKSAADALLADR